jgi:hypothetical protein
MEWQASPRSVTRPRVQAGIGGRANSAHFVGHVNASDAVVDVGMPAAEVVRELIPRPLHIPAFYPPVIALKQPDEIE